MKLVGFEQAHEAFLRHMQVNAPNGESFVSFDHPFIYSDEIKYKRQVHALATDALSLDKWGSYRKETGRILKAVMEACSSRVSSNLLDHRYGEAGPYKSLYKVKSVDEVEGLEGSLFDFFLDGRTSRAQFGPRFDSFAEYLREESLGSNWSFVAYLSFLADHRRYFPILPTRFEDLLHYYEVDQKIVGHVTWARYSVILDVAEEVRDRLVEYKPPDLVSIQSYMWVVSYLLRTDQIHTSDTSVIVDFSSELERRSSSAVENERIGLKGERQVLEHERRKLKEIGSQNLSDQVRLVSHDPSLGYDVLSFRPDGSPIHIEVKATVRSRQSDNGFWLSENERATSVKDIYWTLYRVWDVDVETEIAELGNLDQLSNSGWELKASTWFARRSQ